MTQTTFVTLTLVWPHGGESHEQDFPSGGLGEALRVMRWLFSYEADKPVGERSFVRLRLSRRFQTGWDYDRKRDRPVRLYTSEPFGRALDVHLEAPQTPPAETHYPPVPECVAEIARVVAWHAAEYATVPPAPPVPGMILPIGAAARAKLAAFERAEGRNSDAR